MAKIPQGILGGLRGRVGNVVGAAWKGINYIRSMPLSVANPNTVAQQAQRGAFTQCVAAARLLLSDLIATYWDPYARLMSGYNHFISVNIDAFATAGLTTPASFFASRGILTGIDTFAAVGTQGANIAMTWADNTGIGDALGTDQFVAVVYNVDQDYWKFDTDPLQTRSDGTFSFSDTDILTGDVVHCYGFFIRTDLEKISDSGHYEETCP